MTERPAEWDLTDPKPSQTLDELIAEWDEELGRGYEPSPSERWILSEHPDLDWLVFLPPAKRAPYRHPSLRAGLHRSLPDVPNHVWKVLFDG